MPSIPFRYVALACLLVAVFCSSLNPAHAQFSAEFRDRLLAEIERASERFDAEQLPDLATARQRVLADMDRIRWQMAANTDAANAAAWLAYLQLQPLEEAILKGQPVSEQAQRALSLRERLVGTWPGLELRMLNDLRRDLDRFLAASRFADPETAPDLFRRQLEILAERTSRLEAVPSTDELAALSRILEVLEETGQTDPLLASFREAFAQPNVVLRVSESTIQEAIGQPVDRNEPVQECILGTRLIGRASLNGMITADVLPATDSAQLTISLSGRVGSNNTGYNGPVRLRTIGTGDIHATRVLRISDRGLSLAPPRVWASLRTDIVSIEHRLKLVRKIARNRAAQQKPLADRIALMRLRDRIGSRFADQTAVINRPRVLADADVWLRRLDIPELVQRWSSTDRMLSLHAAVSRPAQLSAPLPAPPPAEDLGAVIQIHESAVDNALARFLGGRTVTQSQIDQLLESLGRESESAATDTDEPTGSEPPFEIDFARLRPVIFEAREESVRLGIRGTRFEQDGRLLNRPLEITAVYRPVTDEQGRTRLVRDEDVSVDFPGGGRLSISQTALRSSIKRLFDDVFPESLLDRPLTVPETSALEAMRGREYRPHHVEAQDGWLTVAIR